MVEGFFLHSVVILHIVDVQANFIFTVTVCEKAKCSASRMAAKFKYTFLYFLAKSKTAERIKHFVAI